MTPKDILTNPVFCPMPWSGLMYNSDGAVKNCIRSAGPIGNIHNNKIEDILLGPDNITKQTNIVEKIPVPTCHTCYDLEQGKKGFDHISDRVFYIRELKHTDPDTYRSGNFDLKTIDVRWSNTCNFACVYCSEEFSSRWADEKNITVLQPSDIQQNNFKNYIFDHAHQLKHVYLAGGEPLLMKQNLELLDRLDPNVNLRINTNLSKVDTQIFNRICKFKNVHWTVSVETMAEEFEYIRFGGNWQDFLDNLHTINQLGHKITFNMLYFILNYQSLFDCVNYFQRLGFHNNSFVIGALLTPEYLNIRNLPDTVLLKIQTQLENLISQNPKYLLEDSYKNLLHYIKQPYKKDLTNSFTQLAIMDRRRNLDSSKIFKDLYTLHE